MVSQTPHPFNKVKRLNRFTHGHFGMETCHQNTSADLQAQLNYRRIMQQVLHCKREYWASNEQVEGILPFKIIHRLLLDLCCLVFPKNLLDESRVWVWWSLVPHSPLTGFLRPDSSETPSVTWPKSSHCLREEGTPAWVMIEGEGHAKECKGKQLAWLVWDPMCKHILKERDAFWSCDVINLFVEKGKGLSMVL